VTVDDDLGYSVIFFEALADLAKSLADQDIAIFEATYHYLSFGGWSLSIGASHRRMRYVFDGKEGLLQIFSSEFPNQGSQPQWKLIESRELGNWAFANPSKQFDIVRSIAESARQA
jgi:hypothetical protein